VSLPAKTQAAAQVANVLEFIKAANTDSKVNIYEQFYLWLDAAHDLPDKSKTRSRDMHSRCRVGKMVSKELRKLEERRQRRVEGRVGIDAKKAAAFRDGDAGPLGFGEWDVFVVYNQHG
jgi:hypothetical protein